jgi:hypothetical protein
VLSHGRFRIRILFPAPFSQHISLTEVLDCVQKNEIDNVCVCVCMCCSNTFVSSSCFLVTLEDTCKSHDLVGVGQKYDVGLKELESRRVLEKWSDNKFKQQVLDLGNRCFGSRGSTPLTSLLKSPLHLLLDALHLRNSLLKICFQVLHKVHPIVLHMRAHH